MRKIFVWILAVTLTGTAVKAQDVALPLGPFRTYLLNKYPGCFVNPDGNGNLMLNTACTAITTEDSLEFHQLPEVPLNPDITFFGLRYFTSLTYLNISNFSFGIFQGIYGTEPLPSSLLDFDISYNSSSSSDFFTHFILNRQIRKINCRNNYGVIWSLPPGLPDSLRYLNCSNSSISNLPALPNFLETLICGGQSGVAPSSNLLGSFPTLPATLKYLDFSGHKFSSLPVFPPGLKYLDCSAGNVNENPERIRYTLRSLSSPLPPALETLICSNNILTSLPPLPPGLKSLDCSYTVTVESNYTTPANPGIGDLATLPVNLTYLDCRGSSLHCLPRLPATLQQLKLDRDSIPCLLNSGIYTITPAGPALPICNATNNPYQCSFINVQGSIFYDYNGNGIRDAGETFASNVAVTGSNGITSYSNNLGDYYLPGTAGNFSVSVQPPQYYAAIPGTANFVFSGNDTTASQTFSLQATVAIDSCAITVIPVQTARPGFPFHYAVYYSNKGTTTIAPNILLNFDNGRLTYSSSSNGSVVQSGSTLSLSAPSMLPGQTGSFLTNFTVNPLALIGDTLRANANITAGTSVSTDNVYSVIRGSFDPNDKQSTPAMSLQQVSQQRFIEYLIRFQNTGTDTAFNVVITDTLSGFADAASFQVRASSHPCRVTRNGNRISFEFLNILLPDSNVNEPASHGFIRFRVRPQSTVISNTLIPNKAAIYFDYNAPVITNTAQTLIQATATPLTLVNFSGYADDKGNAKLSWKTANEQNTAYFEILESKDAVHFESSGSVPARGFGSQQYSFTNAMDASLIYYRLRMYDKDGRFSHSPVIIVKKLQNPKALEILSNPGKDKISVLVRSNDLVNTEARIINSQGQILMRARLKEGVQELNTTRFSAGIYYILAGNTAYEFTILH